MRRIQELLKHYAKLAPPDESIRRATQEALKDICKLHVPRKDISFRNRGVFLDIPPTSRSVVLVHKEAVLKRLRQELAADIDDIR